MNDTIFALASGAGRAGVAVIRISGPQAFAALAQLTGRPLPSPRLATLRRLRNLSGETIDQALILAFPAPDSFTGEDVAELQIHGGQAVIAAIALALTDLGLKPAGPGAFTRRAFEHGKLDLTQAEALADLVEAETEGQRRQALRQMQGALGDLYEDWRAKLIHALALFEAEIDFPDEDLPEALSLQAAPEILALAESMAAHLQDSGRGERVRDGYRVAILGAPNAGKSSLLNALVRREAAIVSEIPGTTRDVVEARIVLAGFPVWIADTAGLREAADRIEAEGVKRALARAADADLRLALLAPGAAMSEELAAALQPGDFLIATKADLGAAPSPVDAQTWFPISTRTGQGLAELEQALAQRVAGDLAAQEAPALTRERHRRLVAEAEVSLRRALASLVLGAELAAEDLRLAARALGAITGRVDVEDVLDEVFSGFCIGK
jgi:tRNA modification GTPase